MIPAGGSSASSLLVQLLLYLALLLPLLLVVYLMFLIYCPPIRSMDSAGSHRESGVSPFADSSDSSSPPPVSTDHVPLDVLFESTSGGINDFFLPSNADAQIGLSRVAVDPDSDDEVETIPDSTASPPRSRRKHRGVRSDDSLWDKPVEDFFSSESESDDDMATYIPPLPYGAFKDWEMVYPIRASLLERMLRHRLTVPPSYCRDIVVAGSVIQTIQAGLRESYECLASVPMPTLQGNSEGKIIRRGVRELQQHINNRGAPDRRQKPTCFDVRSSGGHFRKDCPRMEESTTEPLGIEIIAGFPIFLAHDTTNEIGKSEKKRLEDVLNSFKYFPKVFSENLGSSSTSTSGFQLILYLVLHLLARVLLSNFGAFAELKELSVHLIPKVQLRNIVIDSEGIHVDPAKIESIKDWTSHHMSPAEIHQFLGSNIKGIRIVGTTKRYTEWKWDKHTMDFVTKLPKSVSRLDYNWGVRLTDSLKSAIFTPLRETIIWINCRLVPKGGWSRAWDTPSQSIVIGPEICIQFLESGVKGMIKVLALERGRTFGKRREGLNLDGLHLDDKLHFVEEPVEIVGREVKRLKRSRIPLLKVRWNSKGEVLEYTFGRVKTKFKKEYHILSTKTTRSSRSALTQDDHNKLAYLGRETGCEDFTDILSYLDHSPLRYALTHDPPVVFDSLVKQFWATATVRPNAAGSHDLVATIDGREVVVTESLIRAQLQLDDANGIFDMQIDDILAGMGAIGYPTDRTLTFLKHHLSPQWRFLVHTLMHCLSPKAGSWNQFPSSIATALICLSTANAFDTPMLAIAAAGDAADEDNAAAHAAAGSTAEAHPEPHSPPVSPVREPTPERQPETEWVVPNPVSPLTDWRPWPSVPTHSPTRGPTPEPASPPTPPAQTFIFEEPLVFGPEPRPAGYVDPDVLEPIIFGPQPKPSDFVDPDLEEPVIFGPPPRPDNYIEPADIDNLVSMEDDTIHGGFHQESPVGPDDAPTPTADAAGRAEDPTLLTSLSAKLDRNTCISVKEVESTVKQLKTARLVGEPLLTEGMLDIQDDVDLRIITYGSEALGHDQTVVQSEDMEELGRGGAFAQFHAPLSAAVLPQAAISESAGPSIVADKGKAPMPELDIPAEFLAEDAQARKRLEEEQASERLVHSGVHAHNWYYHDESVKYNYFDPWLLISEPPSKRQRVERASSQPSHVPAATTLLLVIMYSAGGSSFHPAGSAPPLSGSDAPTSVGGVFGVPDSTVSASAAMDSAGSHRESGVSPFADSTDSSSPSPVSTDHIPIDVLFESTSGGLAEFFLDSDEDEQIGMSRVAADPDSDDEVLAEIIFRGQSISGHGVVVVDQLPDDEIVDPRVKVETVSDYASSPPRSRRKHIGVRGDDILWDRPVEDFFSSESESDEDMENYIPPLPYGGFKDWEIVSCPLRNISYHVYHQENRRQKCFTYLKELLPHVYREDLLLLRRRMNRYFRLNPDVDVGLDLWRDVNLLCQSLHSDDVEDFWRTQDEWVVSSWKLYPKSSVHVLDLTNGKTVYMFVDKFYPIRATLLERMLRHRLTVPPSYCRDVVVAGSYSDDSCGFRESMSLFLHCSIACTARQMVFSSPWLTAKKESGSPLQTALVCLLKSVDSCKDVSNPLYGCDGLPKTVRLLFFDDATSVDAAVLDVAAPDSAACLLAAGYIVSAGISVAAGSAVLAVFINICYLLCFCCHSILLLREDLSRNLELTKSKPSLGEDCWELLKTTKCRFCC
ncbi:hypothetical protein Tco_0151505 [Tanacetum coccineum]